MDMLSDQAALLLTMDPEKGRRPSAPDSSVRLSRVVADLSAVLLHPVETDGLARRVDAIARDLRLVVAHDADLALFEVQRYGSSQHGLYSVVHAVQCAIACEFIARRLRWPEESMVSLVKAALTMNIAITELQGALATQTTIAKPTAKQADAIAMHPARGAEILLDAGVRDAAWLRAVDEHHERADGRGYPRGTSEPSRPATTLRYIDEFFAKISSRASRPAMPLQRAARQLYTDADGRWIVETLIKEFGLYPPGTYVRLANGDLGVVLRRGRRVNTPLAVALANRYGERLPRRVYRDTSDTRYAIVMASNMGNEHCR
jgi:HD-GYP domain-containing protein (c-di-GMP phosphodiesterase class II)